MKVKTMKQREMERKHIPEIMYQSEGKAPNGDAFLTVKRARGYYEYSERPGKDSIAFVLYDTDTKKFGLIYESKPPLDERDSCLSMRTTAFGGSIDIDKTYIEICQMEVSEEAGYNVDISSIQSIGKTLVSSQSSQLCEGYIVDVTGLPQGKTEVDIENEKDPDEFKHNKVLWLEEYEVFELEDWKSIWIISKAKFNELI